MPGKTIYTIGHSRHPADYLLELLQQHGVNCVVDVRSIPASRFNPQYSQTNLETFLKAHGISYLHFGKEFGARRTDSSLLGANGKVDFEKVQATADFQNGLNRLWEILDSGFCPALMCAEADPLDCHRFSMIAVVLKSIRLEVFHILKDRQLASQEEMESAMLHRFGKHLPQPSIFDPETSTEDQLRAAYRFLNQRIGWSPKNGQ